MDREIADAFIRALDALERDGEVEPIVDTFAESCEIETPVLPGPLHGKIEARAFWAGYRMAFLNIHSTFRNIVIGGNSIALEWTANCTNRSGRKFHYDGVSILETAGQRITRFRSYFDSRAMRVQKPSRLAVH